MTKCLRWTRSRRVRQSIRMELHRMKQMSSFTVIVSIEIHYLFVFLFSILLQSLSFCLFASDKVLCRDIWRSSWGPTEPEHIYSYMPFNDLISLFLLILRSYENDSQ